METFCDAGDQRTLLKPELMLFSKPGNAVRNGATRQGGATGQGGNGAGPSICFLLVGLQPEGLAENNRGKPGATSGSAPKRKITLTGLPTEQISESPVFSTNAFTGAGHLSGPETSRVAGPAHRLHSQPLPRCKAIGHVIRGADQHRLAPFRFNDAATHMGLSL